MQIPGAVGEAMPQISVLLREEFLVFKREMKELLEEQTRTLTSIQKAVPLPGTACPTMTVDSRPASASNLVKGDSRSTTADSRSASKKNFTDRSPTIRSNFSRNLFERLGKELGRDGVVSVATSVATADEKKARRQNKKDDEDGGLALWTGRADEELDALIRSQRCTRFKGLIDPLEERLQGTMLERLQRQLQSNLQAQYDHWHDGWLRRVVHSKRFFLMCSVMIAINTGWLVLLFYACVHLDYHQSSIDCYHK
eukprot:gnl/TRDRNA2_/TRDRNA2_176126_c4_seq26.p1 gnl/TRDRNA2_/TRDRNA2_176126_c4~~gnl/TRDRNA2_/TRDRNA2_176126_c4_seq26.p1  ORF type:complete len:254 (+),score=28.94 gnl/TRDRNA2_/TRDRNA2_176126_c4_seq26:61-822(+)